MAYTKTAWINKDDPAFDTATAPRLNAQNLNKMEQGIEDAHSLGGGTSFETSKRHTAVYNDVTNKYTVTFDTQAECDFYVDDGNVGYIDILDTNTANNPYISFVVGGATQEQCTLNVGTSGMIYSGFLLEGTYTIVINNLSHSCDIGGLHDSASRIMVNIGEFNNNLSSADNTVQKALDTLDNMGGSSGAGTIDELDDAKNNGGSLYLGTNAGVEGNYKGNVGVGTKTLEVLDSNSYGNVALGAYALNQTDTGDYNIAVGRSSLYKNTTGSHNIALGNNSLYTSLSSVGTIGIGYEVARYISTGVASETQTRSIFLGCEIRPLADNGNNEIIIGNTVTGNGSNTVTIGNSSITLQVLSGMLRVSDTPTYADDASAGIGGLVSGDIYKKSDGSDFIVMIKS